MCYVTKIFAQQDMKQFSQTLKIQNKKKFIQNNLDRDQRCLSNLNPAIDLESTLMTKMLVKYSFT